MPDPCFETVFSPRQRRMLDAALRLFSQYGFRRTSMDAIAAEAPVAKATLYANFGNKEQLFTAVTRYLCGQFLADTQAVMAQPDLDPRDRIHRMLAAKHTRMFELVHAHPHAAELIASKNVHAADAVDRADAAYRAWLVGVLEAARFEASERLADVLQWSALGISRAARDVDDHRARLWVAVDTILGPR